MPFTPFHLGPALFLGWVLFSLVDLPTLLVASVVLDLEPLVVILLGLNYPMHGFLHSFLGGAVAAVSLAFIMSRLSRATQRLMKLLRLDQRYHTRSVVVASLLGTYSHILLDSLLYEDIRPLYPLAGNPFFVGNMFAGISVYGLCVLLLIAGFVLFMAGLVVTARSPAMTCS